MHRHTKLVAVGLHAAAVASKPEHIVFGMGAGDVRLIHLGVRDDTWTQDVPEAEHLRTGAYALIVGWGTSRGDIKRRARELAKLSSLKLVSETFRPERPTESSVWV